MTRIKITPELVRVAAPGCKDPVAAARALDQAAAAAGITSRRAVAMLLAQLAHESNLNPGVENLNYSAKRMAQVWPSRYAVNPQARIKGPNATALRLAAQGPEAIANNAYGGRMGNTQPGDGWRYRGRGYIQITGRDMYRRLGYEARPDALLDHTASADAAVKFLKIKGIDLDSDSIEQVTRLINGGYNGLPDRQARFAKLMAAIPEPIETPVQRFLLVPMGGGEAAAWNGRDNPYGGNVLGPELLATLDLTYPTPGGPWSYGNLKLWRRRDGTFVLERR